jgi:hypothetical protein
MVAPHAGPRMAGEARDDVVRAGNGVHAGHPGRSTGLEDVAEQQADRALTDDPDRLSRDVTELLDGDADREDRYPTICGTGTEDYFGGAWNFDVPGQGYTAYTTPYLGLHQIITPDGLYDSQQRFGMYRWHVADPIRFETDLTVEIQALGWRAGRRYLPLRDDIASTALFYLDAPIVAGRPPTPDLETGQVVFFDAGIVDNRNCARKLQLRTADARGEQTADDVVTLVLRHDNFVPAAGSVCTGDPANVRPYAVFYIESRGDLMVREELR